MKMKKCSTCSKYIHKCNDQGWPCKCIRRNCCVCLPKEHTKSFPRPCPCTKPECQDKWKKETKEDDADNFQEHCKCHGIRPGSTGFHCESCSEWICEFCNFFITDELKCQLDEDDDINTDDTYCRPCFIEFLSSLRSKFEKRKMKIINSVELLARASDEINQLPE